MSLIAVDMSAYFNGFIGTWVCIKGKNIPPKSHSRPNPPPNMITSIPGSSGRVYSIMHHVARFHAVRPLCLSEYHVEGVMVLKCPFSTVMTLSDGVLIVFISRKGAILSRNNKA